MWSDSYYYLNIYSNDDLSLDFDTKILSDFLKTFTELHSITNFEFRNTPTFPFTSISLRKVKSINNWSDSDIDNNKTNLISIVCSKNNEENFENLKSLFVKIASFVNWQLVDEETDENIENYVLWKPEGI